MSEGRSSRAIAMTVPGMVLSQPESVTRPSKWYPRATSSMESATTSLLTSDAFIPAVPMVMPSETAMVLNSRAAPPASRTPSFTQAPSSRRWALQGVVSVQVLATPIKGRPKSSSPRPTARSIARAPARSRPRTRSWLMSGSRRVDSPLIGRTPASVDSPGSSTRGDPAVLHGRDPCTPSAATW